MYYLHKIKQENINFLHLNKLFYEHKTYIQDKEKTKKKVPWCILHGFFFIFQARPLHSEDIH